MKTYTSITHLFEHLGSRHQTLVDQWDEEGHTGVGAIGTIEFVDPDSDAPFLVVFPNDVAVFVTPEELTSEFSPA